MQNYVHAYYTQPVGSLAKGLHLIGGAKRALSFIANDEISVWTNVCDGGHFPYIQIIRTTIGCVYSIYDWLRMMSELQDALHHSSWQ